MSEKAVRKRRKSKTEKFKDRDKQEAWVEKEKMEKATIGRTQKE